MFYGGSLMSTSAGSLHILLSTHGEILRQVAAAAVVVTAASVVDHMAAVLAIVLLLIVAVHSR